MFHGQWKEIDDFDDTLRRDNVSYKICYGSMVKLIERGSDVCDWTGGMELGVASSTQCHAVFGRTPFSEASL